MTQLQLIGEPKTTSPLAPLDVALQRIFNPASEQTPLQKARQIMGGCLGDISDEDLEIYLTEFQHLVDCWLDAYERDVFSGLTLQQVLGQG